MIQSGDPMLILPKVARDASSGLVKKVGKIVVAVLATATMAGYAAAGAPVPNIEQSVSIDAPMLMSPSGMDGVVSPWHSSHSSHMSHSSHSSHMSHYSGRY